MKKILVLGAGSYARTVTFYATRVMDWLIEAYVADNEFISQESFMGKPLIAFEKVESVYPPEEFSMLMAIGYRNMNERRKQKFLQAKKKKYYFENLIHPTAILNNTVLSEGNVILENVIIEPNSKIGSNCVFWSGAFVAHDCIIASHNFLSAFSLVAGFSVIEEGCFMGVHTTVRDGITIAHHTLIGAGAYVSKPTNPYDVVVPARSITLEGKYSLDMI